VKGNYNGALLGKKIDGRMHIFGVPSLITRNINSVSIIDVVRDNSFVLDSYEALPDAFTQNEEEKARKVSFDPASPESIVVFSGSVDALATQEGLLSTATNLENLYTDTGLNNYDPVKSYTATAPDDAATVKDLAVKLDNNKSISSQLGDALKGFVDGS
jgi:hypothetical protein